MARIPWRGNQSYEGKNRTRDWINRERMATVLRGTRLSELSELPCRYAVLVLRKNAIKQFFNQCYRWSKEQFARDSTILR